MNTTIHVPPEVAETLPPNCAALIVQGACMEPEICDGDVVLFEQGGAASAGDLVVIWSAEGNIPMLKRMTCAAPPVFGPLPAGSEVGYLVICSQSNPPKTLHVNAERVSRIDRVAAVVPAATAILSGDRP